MKILIDIPKEFIGHFETDRFEDALHRLNADAHLLAGNYEQEVLNMLIQAFKNAMIPVQETHEDHVDITHFSRDAMKHVTYDGEMLDFVLTMLTDICGFPCDYCFYEESVPETIYHHDQKWCENECCESAKNCWLKYFECLKEEDFLSGVNYESET